MNALLNIVKVLKRNIGDFTGEYINIHSSSDEEGYPVKNPMVYCNAEDQNEALEEVAKIIQNDGSVEIYASGHRFW